MDTVTRFFSEVKGELLKVTWPSRQEVVRLTFVVIIVSAIVGVYLGGLDLGFTKLLEYILSN